MNPAHYTVWLYRFKVVSQLELPVPEEIEWLNAVSLEHIKNYQIWHHRQLLIDYHYPRISSDETAVRKLGRSETAFIEQMLEADTKNYHVWSYRKYLVSKLRLFDVRELGKAQSMIEDDVRNNSAWAHRFFLVFSDPKYADPASRPTMPDGRVPAQIIDREVAFAMEKIRLAPQNQSAWNYLRGTLTKGSRPVSSAAELAEEFVEALGEGEEREIVKSSHALDLLATTHQERGDLEKAKLCLQRLWEKWDPVREGYWKYRESQLQQNPK